MAGQVQLFSILLVALAVFDGGSSVPIGVQENDHRRIASANINELFDALLPTLREAMLELGMEPLRLKDFSERLLPLPGKLKGSIDFTNGWLQQLSTLKRASDVTMSYIDKRLILETNLGWDLLDFNYEYDLRYLVYKRTGDVYGRFKNAEVRSVVVVDLKNYKISMETIKFTKIGGLDVKFEGRILDPIVNAAAKAATTLFRRAVLNMVEERAMRMIGEALADINEIIPRPDRPVDASKFTLEVR